MRVATVVAVWQIQRKNEMDDTSYSESASPPIFSGGASNISDASPSPTSAIPAEPEKRLFNEPVRQRRRVNVRVHTFDSLKERNFLLFWMSILWMGGAFWIQMFIVGWLAYDMTQSAFLTSVAVGLQMAPFIVGGPLGGIIADRFDRQRVLLIVVGYQTVAMAAFAALVLSGRMEIWHLLAFAVALGLGTAMSEPVRFALIPLLVPKHSMVNAFALNGLAFNIARFIMPALAGFLVLWIGPGPTVLVAVGTLLISGLSIALMHLDEDVRCPAKSTNTDGPIHKFIDGLRYAKEHPLVLGSVLMGAFAPFLLIPAVSSLMPVYADRVFHVDSDGLGILMAAIGIGGTAGAILVASVGNIKRKGQIMVGLLVVSTIMAVLFSQTGSFAIAVILLALLFMGLPSFWAIQGATIQEVVPNELRGRVASIGPTLVGFYPLGSVLAGTLAERYGAQTATLVAALLYLLVLGVLLVTFRSVWRYRTE